MLIDVLLLAVSLAALYYGAEWLVQGASRVAAHLRISTMVIGLTVVAFGTSMPEMVAGVVAARNGATDIVLGNVFGSNIANIGLILGLSALLRTVPVRLQLLRREIPMMLLGTIGVYALAASGSISRLAGVALFVALIAFTWLALRWTREEPDGTLAEEFERLESQLGLDRRASLGLEVGRLVVGLLVLTGGAAVLVDVAVSLAREFGVSEFVIAVSMVAIGTSLPELATSIVCALRGETDVLVGNIVGSNIFNLLGALGLAAVVAPIPVAAAQVSFDLPVVLAFSLFMTAAVATSRGLVRWHGAALLVGYVVYLAIALG